MSDKPGWTPASARRCGGGRNVTVTTRLGDVDVVQRLPGVPRFAALEMDAVGVEIFDVSFRVCSRAHLIAMKRARGSAIDLADLERLTAGGHLRGAREPGAGCPRDCRRV